MSNGMRYIIYASASTNMYIFSYCRIFYTYDFLRSLFSVYVATLNFIIKQEFAIICDPTQTAILLGGFRIERNSSKSNLIFSKQNQHMLLSKLCEYYAEDLQLATRYKYSLLIACMYLRHPRSKSSNVWKVSYSAMCF